VLTYCVTLFKTRIFQYSLQNKKESIFDNNYFSVLEEVIPDPNISIDDVSKKFISTSFNIAKELNITSMSEVRKSFFHMSQKVFNFQKLKMKLYKNH